MMKQEIFQEKPSAETMPNFQLQTLSISVAVAFSMSWTTGVHADEAPLCHDMSARKAVLEEGQQYLQNSPSSGKAYGTTRPYGDDGDKYYFDWDEMRHEDWDDHASQHYSNTLLRYSGSRTSGVPHIDISDVELEATPVDTPQQLDAAQSLAERLEHAHQFIPANKLYVRILKQREKQPPDAKLARALESVALTEISSDAEVPFNKPKDSNQPFAAEELYSRALAIHRRLKDDDSQLISDLLWLGVLKSRRTRLEEAKLCFAEAMERDPDKASAYVADFCRDHKDFDFAKKYESKILNAAHGIRDPGPVSNLLALYVAENKSTDAVQLFKQAMSNSLLLPADLLIAMFDVMNPADVSAVAEYVPRVWSALDKDCNRLMLAMEQHGWSDQVDSICEAFAQDKHIAKVIRLFAVANCYEQLKKYPRALLKYKEIAAAVETEHEPDAEAIKDLSHVGTAINTIHMKQQPGSQVLSSNTTRLIAFHNDQIRRRQCLEMAKQLNHTAFELEKNCSFAMAQKLYQQALEIKQLNLAANDPETANQMLDVARNAGEQKHYLEAQSLYERALATLRKSPHTDPSDTIGALESYGQILNQMKQEAKAVKIYDEAKVLSRKIQRM